MIPYSHRFHGHASLKFVFKNGTSYRSRFLMMKVTSNPRRKKTRMAVVVSKKIHKSAVRRNRVRRRIYEILRRESERFDGVFDIVVVVSSPELISSTHQELHKQITELARDAGLYQR